MNVEPFDYGPYIEQARQTPSGHLQIGRGGFTLHCGRSRLSGYDCDRIKQIGIAAGLPVIDSRTAPIELVTKLSCSGPMIAVVNDPDPRPWRAMSYAPLGAVAAAYRRAGAEIFNIDEASLDEEAFTDPPDPSLAGLIKGWLAYVRRAA